MIASTAGMGGGTMAVGQFGGAFKKAARAKDSKKSNNSLHPLNRMSTKRANAKIESSSSSEDSSKSGKKFDDSIIEEDDEDSVSDSDSSSKRKKKKTLRD